MFVLLNKEDKVKKPACLIILESIEAYVNEVIKIHSYELIQAGEAAEWPVLNILIIAFIEALKRSEIPKDLHDEIMGRVGKAVVSIPEGVSLNSMREGLRGLRSHLQLQHICPQCGKTSECSSDLNEHYNFKCGNCGYEQHVLFRRELVDLNDPMEGELALRIAAECLK